MTGKLYGVDNYRCPCQKCSCELFAVADLLVENDLALFYRRMIVAVRSS